MTADATLVAQSLQNDRAAFGQIVERYQAMVCAVAYSIVGDVAGSEDVAQEAFLAAWRQLGSLREPDRLRAWLAGIARNTARATVRSRLHDPLRRPAAIDAATPAQGVSPTDLVAQAEEEALVWRVLEQIPETYREPLVLFYREHQSIAEVAETMSLSEDAVKQRLARGRQALKEQVADVVEGTLRRTGPKAAFTAGVMAAMNGAAGPANAAVAGGGAVAGGASMGVAAGLAGAITGSLVGLAGGIFGTWCGIRNSKPGPERAFVIKASIATWLYVTILLGISLGAAFWQRWLFEAAWFQIAFWTIHGVVMMTGITWMNRRQAQIRQEQESK